MNRRFARAAICSIRSPNSCSTNNRNSCAAAALDAFNAELSHARDALARVEKRVERIERIAGSEANS